MQRGYSNWSRILLASLMLVFACLQQQMQGTQSHDQIVARLLSEGYTHRQVCEYFEVDPDEWGIKEVPSIGSEETLDDLARDDLARMVEAHSHHQVNALQDLACNSVHKQSPQPVQHSIHNILTVHERTFPAPQPLNMHCSAILSTDQARINRYIHMPTITPINKQVIERIGCVCMLTPELVEAYMRSRASHELFTDYNKYTCDGYMTYLRLHYDYEDFIDQQYEIIKQVWGICRTENQKRLWKLHGELHTYRHKRRIVEQQSTQHVYNTRMHALPQMQEEWKQLEEIATEYQFGNVERFKKRVDACKNMEKEGVKYTEKKYELPYAMVMEVQNKKGFEFVAYDTCYGNQIQQVLHQECIDVFNKTVTVCSSSVAYDHHVALCNTIDAAAVYNQEGFVDKASMVLDFCWTVLDYGQAVLEGAGLGIVGVAQHAYDHPITTIASVVAGEVVLGYQLAKLMIEVADIGITYAMNADEGAAKLEEYIKPLTQVIDTLSSKEMTMRSALKCGAAVAVGFKAQTTLLGGLQQFYAGIKSNASMYIRSYPSATVEQYLPTPRGGLLKSVTERSRGGSSPSNIKSLETIKQVISKIAKMTSKEATEVAKRLGFCKTNYYSQGQPVFKKGNIYITPDVDQHNGGIWKMANSVENLLSKKTRMGTYDLQLNRIGD